MFKIGNIKIKNNIVMAPMAGISNPAFMRIIEEMKAGLAFTELISSEAVVRNNKKTFDMLNGIKKLSMPIGIQIFGSNPDTMASAAKILVEKYNVPIIDINMGCPVFKVAISSKAGSALLKDPDKVYEIVKKVVRSVNVPITVKIRSGWDSNSINAVEIAKIIEKAGAKAITIHARTRSQGYSGKADWDIIKQVKDNVSIPVIGNGDIKNCYDALKMLQETKCDAVMIGRGLMGNPWLIKDCIDYLEKGITPKPVSLKERFNMIKKHLDLLLDTKCEKVALLEMRTHIVYYLKGVEGSKELKQQIMKTQSKDEIISLLDNFIDNK